MLDFGSVEYGLLVGTLLNRRVQCLENTSHQSNKDSPSDEEDSQSVNSTADPIQEPSPELFLVAKLDYFLKGPMCKNLYIIFIFYKNCKEEVFFFRTQGGDRKSVV